MFSNEHMIIDAHNVIHAVAQLKKWVRRGKDPLGLAQKRLSDTVRVLHDFEERAVTLVFDGRGPAMSIEYPFEVKTFTWIFSECGSSADAIIEQMLSGCERPEMLTVVTEDRLILQSASVAGAMCLSPLGLMDTIAVAERKMREFMDRGFEGK